MAGLARSLTPRTATAVFDRLAGRRLLVVSGKGGVGRTTVSALLGLALARRGRRVLVATTGHDDRLAWMLGAPSLTDGVQNVGEGLHIQRLVPQTCIREYGGLVLRSTRLSSAVFDNRVVRRLMRAIPGLDDFSVLGKAWHEGVRGGHYDAVIFDGPATGHLLYTLGVPQAILETVSKGPLTREARLIQDSFEDAAQVEAVLVGLPEQWPLTELGELGAAIRERIRMHVASIVVNGVWPHEVPKLRPPTRDEDPQGLVVPVLAEVDRVARIGQRHRASIEAWKGSQAARDCGADALLSLPWRWQGIRAPDDLRQILDDLEHQEAG